MSAQSEAIARLLDMVETLRERITAEFARERVAVEFAQVRAQLDEVRATVAILEEQAAATAERIDWITTSLDELLPAVAEPEVEFSDMPVPDA